MSKHRFWHTCRWMTTLTVLPTHFYLHTRLFSIDKDPVMLFKSDILNQSLINYYRSRGTFQSYKYFTTLRRIQQFIINPESVPSCCWNPSKTSPFHFSDYELFRRFSPSCSLANPNLHILSLVVVTTSSSNNSFPFV